MKKILGIALITLILSSCSTYKMEVQQGNIISNNEVSQLQKGMSKNQVASLLGTPLLQDSFRNNRWDYVYFIKNGKSQSKQQGLTLHFQNDQLITVTN